MSKRKSQDHFRILIKNVSDLDPICFICIHLVWLWGAWLYYNTLLLFLVLLTCTANLVRHSYSCFDCSVVAPAAFQNIIDHSSSKFYTDRPDIDAKKLYTQSLKGLEPYKCLYIFMNKQHLKRAKTSSVFKDYHFILNQATKIRCFYFKRKKPI